MAAAPPTNLLPNGVELDGASADVPIGADVMNLSPASAPIIAPLADEGLKIVTTPEGLLRAVAGRARDIEVQAHLDLTQLNKAKSQAPLGPPNPLAQAKTHLMYVTAATRSIRGNCANASAAVDLISTDLTMLPPPLPIKPLQCVLIVGDSMMQFLNGTQWLDNFYFRLQRTRVDPNFCLLELGWSAPRALVDSNADVPTSQVFMTNVTVQGTRRGSASVLKADRGSRALVEDCIFADLYGSGYPFHASYEASMNFVHSIFRNIFVTSPIVEVASGGIAAFTNSTFRNIHVPNNRWVDAKSDDGWTFFLVNTSITLVEEQSDVFRGPVNDSVLASDGVDTDTGEEPLEFFVSYDMIVDESYGLLDYFVSTDEVVLPKHPFVHPNDTWFLRTRTILPQRPAQATAAPPTDLGFEPRGAWPAIGGAGARGNGTRGIAGGFSGSAHDSDSGSTILTVLLFAASLLVVVAAAVVVRHVQRRHRDGAVAVRTLDSELTVEAAHGALGRGGRILETLHEISESSALDSPHPNHTRRSRAPHKSLSWAWLSRTRAPSTARPLPANCTTSTAASTNTSDSGMLPPMPPRAGALEISSQHMWEFSWSGNGTHTQAPARYADTACALGRCQSEFEAQFQVPHRAPASAPATAEFPSQHWTFNEAARTRGPRPRVGTAPSTSTTWLYVPEYSEVTSAGHTAAGASQWPPSVATMASRAASAPLPPRMGTRGVPGGAASPPPWVPHDRTITTFHRGATQPAPATRSPRIAVQLTVTTDSSEGDHSARSVQVLLRDTAGEIRSRRSLEPSPDDPPSDALRVSSSTSTSANSAPAAACRISQDPPESLTGPLTRSEVFPSQTIAAVFPEQDPARPSLIAQRGLPSATAASSGARSFLQSAPTAPPTPAAHVQLSPPRRRAAYDGSPQRSIPRAAPDPPPAEPTHGGVLFWLQQQTARLPRRGRRSARPPPPPTTGGGDGVPGVAGSGGEACMALFPSWEALQLQDRWGEQAESRELRRVERVLNAMGEGAVVFGKYRILNRKERRRGGQAVVQFATLISDGTPCAMKFFADRSAFHTEVALYAACGHTATLQSPDWRGRVGGAAHAGKPDTGKFLPRAEAIEMPPDPAVEGMAAVSDGMSRHATRLPPCIVMEKGESLHDWSQRAEPDFFMALAVLSNVASRLADMHGSGYVHRDLKPSNVMWLPRENRWTVIDFGCAARAGEHAPVCFTLTYAAPEVLHAYEHARLHGGLARCEVACAADMWALGVMAFELLTGRAAFNLLTDSRQHVVAQLLGDLPLPWEGELTDAVRDCLGGFKGPILRLLQRDPLQRDTASQFFAACRHVTSATR
eukprot:jgi/Ulvmu1/8553/UM044_0087.1